MTRVLGLDPGRRTGFAWRSSAGPWRTGTVNLEGLPGILEEARADGCELVALEDIYLGPSVRTFKMLAVTQGKILALCAAAGLEVETIPPITWKSAMLTVGGYMARGRADQKQAASWTARALGADPANDHEGDAVCLAEYLAAAGRQQQLALKRRR